MSKFQMSNSQRSKRVHWKIGFLKLKQEHIAFQKVERKENSEVGKNVPFQGQKKLIKRVQ